MVVAAHYKGRSVLSEELLVYIVQASLTCLVPWRPNRALYLAG